MYSVATIPSTRTCRWNLNCFGTLVLKPIVNGLVFARNVSSTSILIAGMTFVVNLMLITGFLRLRKNWHQHLKTTCKESTERRPHICSGITPLYFHSLQTTPASRSVAIVGHGFSHRRLAEQRSEAGAARVGRCCHASEHQHHFLIGLSRCF